MPLVERRDAGIGAGIGGAFLLLYIATSSVSVLGGDNAEFSSLARTPGVAHPSGYPLFVLYLRAFSWIPASSPAHGSAMATAVLGAAAVGILYVAARRWGAGRFAATLACTVYGLSRSAWIAGSHAEVFALNTLLAAAIVAACVEPTPESSGPGRRLRLPLLGGLAGLALANHLTSVLLAPIGLTAVGLGLVAAWRQGGVAASTRLASATLGAFLLGLSPYLTMLNVHPPVDAWSWGTPDSILGILRHFLRDDYGATELGLREQGGQPAEHIASLGRASLQDLLGLPLLALPLGTVFLWRRGSTGRGMAEAAALIATLLLAGPVFISRFNLVPRGLSLAVVERFYLLPELLSALVSSFGLTLISDWIRPRLRRRLQHFLAVSVLFVTGVAAAGAAYPSVAEHHSRAVQSYLENCLRSAPPGAVLLGTGDHRVFGFDYLRSVLGERRDVVYVDPLLLHYPWYQRRMEERLGFAIPGPVGSSVNSTLLAETILSAGRPVFITDVFASSMLRALPSAPHGVLIRIYPRGASVPSPDSLLATTAGLFDDYDLDYAIPESTASWAYEVHREYGKPWLALAGAFQASGATAAAQEMRRRAAYFLEDPLNPAH